MHRAGQSGAASLIGPRRMTLRPHTMVPCLRAVPRQRFAQRPLACVWAHPFTAGGLSKPPAVSRFNALPAEPFPPRRGGGSGFWHEAWAGGALTTEQICQGLRLWSACRTPWLKRSGAAGEGPSTCAASSVDAPVASESSIAVFRGGIFGYNLTPPRLLVLSPASAGVSSVVSSIVHAWAGGAFPSFRPSACFAPGWPTTSRSLGPRQDTARALKIILQRACAFCKTVLQTFARASAFGLRVACLGLKPRLPSWEGPFARAVGTADAPVAGDLSLLFSP